MDDTYRKTELHKAQQELARWREAYQSQAVFNAKKREAARQIEFWSDKAAFLSHAS